MRRRYGLLAFGGVFLLLTLGGCAVSAEPAATTAANILDNDVGVAPNVDTPVPPVAVTPEEKPATQPAISAPAGLIVPVSLDVALDGDFVIIPLAAVEDARNTQFSVTLGDRLLDFMAYTLDGGLFVRSSACPPCDSRSFALDGDTLVCESCSTLFDALTGEGVHGACADYPKAEVACSVSEGFVTMGVADLVRAYDEILRAGSGPLEAETVVAEEPAEIDTRPACCR